MKDLEKQLQQIKAVRALRVNSKLREQAKSRQDLQLAEMAVETAEQKIVDEELQAITIQRDGISKLVGGSLVNIDRLMDFNVQKLKSIKRISDAKVELRGLNDEKTDATEKFSFCVLATKDAEKRLMGIEEVIAQQLWK